MKGGSRARGATHVGNWFTLLVALPPPGNPVRIKKACSSSNMLFFSASPSRRAMPVSVTRTRPSATTHHRESSASSRGSIPNARVCAALEGLRSQE
jgi:hypothetical protein